MKGRKHPIQAKKSQLEILAESLKDENGMVSTEKILETANGMSYREIAALIGYLELSIPQTLEVLKGIQQNVEEK